MPHWLTDLLLGIFGNVLYDLVFAAVVATGIGFLRSTSSKWAAPVLYGIAVFTCMLIIGYVLTGQTPLSKQQTVTTENAEENLKKWAEDLGMSIEKTNRPDSYFSYTMRLHNSDPVEVFRAKEKPVYLQFMSTITVAPGHQAALAKLTQSESNKLVERLNFEIARANLGCTFGTASAQNTKSGNSFLVGAFLQRGVPIESLNEGSFGTNYDEVTRGVLLVRSMIQLEAEYKSAT